MTLQHSYSSFVFNITALSVLAHNVGRAAGQGWEVMAENAGAQLLKLTQNAQKKGTCMEKALKVNMIFDIAFCYSS